MVSRFLAAAGGLAAFLFLSSLTSAAQSATVPPPPSPTQQLTTAPAQPTGGLAPGAPPLHLEDLPPDPHTPTPTELAQERQQQAMAAAMRVASMQARWGAPMSTPGMSVALAEIGRTKAPDGATQIAYQITGSGFRPGEKLELIRWPLDSRSEAVMGGLLLNPKGVVVCGSSVSVPGSGPSAAAQTSNPPTGSSAPSDSNPTKTPPAPPICALTMKPNQPVEIQTTAAPGEAIRVAVIDEDHRNGAAVSAVPFPIVNKDRGCKLQVLLGTKNAAMVLLEGTGFPRNSSLKLDTTTSGDTRTVTAKTNPDGNLVVAVLSGAQGHEAGDTTVRYAGILHTPSLQTPAAPPPADPGCAPSVSFPWGKGSYKPQ